jgi:hypothetical protein
MSSASALPLAHRIVEGKGTHTWQRYKLVRVDVSPRKRSYLAQSYIDNVKEWDIRTPADQASKIRVDNVYRLIHLGSPDQRAE